MSLGNGNPKDGDKGSNFNYELKVLQGLQCICNEVKAINIDTDDLEQLLAELIANIEDGLNVNVTNAGGASAVNIQDGGNSITVDGGTGVQRTPTFLRPAGLSGTIPAGRYSMSFANVGTINATVGGITLKPGETINFDAGAINNTLGSVSYNATGAGGELLIISLI
jgi:hypothetical protein